VNQGRSKSLYPTVQEIVNCVHIRMARWHALVSRDRLYGWGGAGRWRPRFSMTPQPSNQASAHREKRVGANSVDLLHSRLFLRPHRLQVQSVRVSDRIAPYNRAGDRPRHRRMRTRVFWHFRSGMVMKWPTHFDRRPRKLQRRLGPRELFQRDGHLLSPTQSQARSRFGTWGPISAPRGRPCRVTLRRDLHRTCGGTTLMPGLMASSTIG